ncbi:ribonuclease H2 subunit B-like [Dreissena polymorpha]|nr:ribonuclease H2 subunit B-like [Dreissena polymorpha]
MPGTRRKVVKTDPVEESEDSCDDDDKCKDEQQSGSASNKYQSEKRPAQWMFMLSDEILKRDSNVDNLPVLAHLRHPRTDKCSLFMFSDEDRTVHELYQFKEEYSSWLIGDTVQSDGSMYITTPVDCVFLALPYLIKAAQTGKFMTLDQIITDDDYAECRRLVTACERCDLHLVTDVKGGDDLKAYKYNEEKTLSWLKRKTERLSTELSDKNVFVGLAKAADLVHSRASPEEYLRYAHGMVSDYLSIDMANSLREHLGIPAVLEKRPSDANNPPAKFEYTQFLVLLCREFKLEDMKPSEDYSQNWKQETKENKAKQTAAQKKLDKVDKSGMKSMMSFFSPKQKS